MADGGRQVLGTVEQRRQVFDPAAQGAEVTDHLAGGILQSIHHTCQCLLKLGDLRHGVVQTAGDQIHHRTADALAGGQRRIRFRFSSRVFRVRQVWGVCGILLGSAAVVLSVVLTAAGIFRTVFICVGGIRRILCAAAYLVTSFASGVRAFRTAAAGSLFGRTVGMIARRRTVPAGGVLLRTVLGIVVQQLAGESPSLVGSFRTGGRILIILHLAAGIHQPQIVHLLGCGGTLSQNLLAELLEGHLRLCLIGGFQLVNPFFLYGRLQHRNPALKFADFRADSGNLSLNPRFFRITCCFLKLLLQFFQALLILFKSRLCFLQIFYYCRSGRCGFLRIFGPLQFQQILIEGLAIFFYIGAMRFLHLIDGSGANVLIFVDGLIKLIRGVLYGAAQSLLQRLQAFA